ncbi:SGNH hydrolase [Auricularia subglabra TFB-10046 SS5]|nr:SGNH hydrolase [Auricularia subglabra TFB-10046 SS5]
MYLAPFLLAAGALAIRAQAGPPLGFVLVGDSTTNNGTQPNTGGWSNGFCAALADVPRSACINAAHDGATTGSTIASGQFETALGFVRALVAEGRRTLVTVQFGHNDQKIAPPESMGANLTIMVDAIRAANGEPVLVTSLTRRNFFANGSVNDALEPWAEETLLIASQEGAHALDLHQTSIDYITAIGPDAAHRLNRLPDDNTHLNANGTIVFGRMVAELMSASFPGIVELTVDEELDFNITHGIPSF